MVKILVMPSLWDSQGAAGYAPLLAYKSVEFYGWFGLILAVQQQPVIVTIDATAFSFINYNGVRAFIYLNFVDWVLLERFGSLLVLAHKL